jgi:hypothetical protein
MSPPPTNIHFFAGANDSGPNFVSSKTLELKMIERPPKVFSIVAHSRRSFSRRGPPQSIRRGRRGARHLAHLLDKNDVRSLLDHYQPGRDQRATA